MILIHDLKMLVLDNASSVAIVASQWNTFIVRSSGDQRVDSIQVLAGSGSHTNKDRADLLLAIASNISSNGIFEVDDTLSLRQIKEAKSG